VSNAAIELMRRLPPILDSPSKAGDTSHFPSRLTMATDGSFQDVPYLQENQNGQLDYSFPVGDGVYHAAESSSSYDSNNQEEVLSPCSSALHSQQQGGIVFDFQDFHGNLQSSNGCNDQSSAVNVSKGVHNHEEGWNSESDHYGEQFTCVDQFVGDQVEEHGVVEKNGVHQESPLLEIIPHGFDPSSNNDDKMQSNEAHQRLEDQNHSTVDLAPEERVYVRPSESATEEVPSLHMTSIDTNIDSGEDEEMSEESMKQAVAIDDAVLSEQVQTPNVPKGTESNNVQTFNWHETNDREPVVKNTGMATWPAPLDDKAAYGNISELPCSDDTILQSVEKTGELMVRIVTWNQQAKDPPPPRTLVDHLVPRRRFHIIALCTQECENTISKSFFTPTKAKWETAISIAVGPDYDVIRSQALQASHSIIFVHRSLLPLISNVKATVVPTGFMDVLGNKGGIGISFNVGISSFCIINAHLAASQFAVQKRIDGYARISSIVARRMSSNRGRIKNVIDIVKSHTRSRNQISPAKDLAPGWPAKEETLLSMFDFVFWAGDLNFRSNGTRAIIDSLLKADAHQILLNNDQLSLLIQVDPTFNGIEEGPLNFRPTYKFDKESGKCKRSYAKDILIMVHE